MEAKRPECAAAIKGDVTMKEKEKLTAEIEAKLVVVDEMIAGLKQRAKEDKHIDSATEKRIAELTHKRNEVHGKLEALQQSDENTWETLKSELHDYLDDIDKQQRESWSYMK
ncbi:MAG: hypothetical protein C4519_19570 [Desulfobacteraceae bacterium]|nr:MAG: hypothetical protein C4519_19570 [Desulfobacteraceae bacterium]